MLNRGVDQGPIHPPLANHDGPEIVCGFFVDQVLLNCTQMQTFIHPINKETHMKKSIRTLLLLVLAVLLSVSLTGVASATRPEAALFEFDLVITGPDSADGTFTASGAIDDYGPAHQVFWYTDDGNVQGIKTMEGQMGTITLKFTATPTPEGVAIGHFVVMGGTGAYENLHGQGDTYAALVFEPIPGIVGSYSGKVHIDP